VTHVAPDIRELPITSALVSSPPPELSDGRGERRERDGLPVNRGRGLPFPSYEVARVPSFPVPTGAEQRASPGKAPSRGRHVRDFGGFQWNSRGSVVAREADLQWSRAFVCVRHTEIRCVRSDASGAGKDVARPVALLPAVPEKVLAERR
jgi:hypothetical protein